MNCKYYKKLSDGNLTLPYCELYYKFYGDYKHYKCNGIIGNCFCKISDLECKNCKRKLPNKNYIRNNKCIWCDSKQGEEMNKPEKHKIDYTLGRKDLIWNKCCEEWEKFLPNEEELKSIIYCTTQYLPIPDYEKTILNSMLYKKISERLRG